MNKSTKIAFSVAAVMIFFGAIICGLGFWGLGFDITGLSHEGTESKTFDISEEFLGIAIDTDTADLHFTASEDGLCRIMITAPEDEVYKVNAADGTLNIINEERPWYENIHLFSFSETRITVYLPKTNYSSILINERTGDIEMPEVFTFEKAAVRSTTGDVRWLAQVSEELSITTDTGDLSVSGVRDTHSIRIETDTGDILLDNVITGGTLMIDTDTGDVAFERCDAAEIYIETDTGDVSGSLLSDKVFLTETDTGDVDVPGSVTGGRCEIVTSTGDIELRIEK